MRDMENQLDMKNRNFETESQTIDNAFEDINYNGSETSSTVTLDTSDNQTVTANASETDVTEKSTNFTVSDNGPVSTDILNDNYKSASKSLGLLDELRFAIKDKYINIDSDVESLIENSECANVPVSNANSEEINVQVDKSETLRRVAAVGVAIVPKPIFFKTSIKRDPGSKLQDELVKELNSVLKNRDNENINDTQVEVKKTTSYEKPKLKKPNSVQKLFDSDVLANLENHFLNRTLQRKGGKERSSVKDLTALPENQHDALNDSNSTSCASSVVDLSFDNVKQKWVKKTESQEPVLKNTDIVLELKAETAKKVSNFDVNSHNSFRRTVGKRSGNQNNVSKSSSDQVYQYGLRNGVMYTATVKSIKEEDNFQFTVISISGKRMVSLVLFFWVKFLKICMLCRTLGLLKMTIWF